MTIVRRCDLPARRWSAIVKWASNAHRCDIKTWNVQNFPSVRRSVLNVVALSSNKIVSLPAAMDDLRARYLFSKTLKKRRRIGGLSAGHRGRRGSRHVGDGNDVNEDDVLKSNEGGLLLDIRQR